MSHFKPFLQNENGTLGTAIFVLFLLQPPYTFALRTSASVQENIQINK